MIVLLPILFIPFLFDVPALVFLGLRFLMQLFSGSYAVARSGQVAGIAWWAHVGGFLAGSQRPYPGGHRDLDVAVPAA